MLMILDSAGNNFLFGISAASSMKKKDAISFFQHLFSLTKNISEVNEKYDNFPYFRFISILQDLGHIEIDQTGNIFICPPSLILTPETHPYRAILCGARDNIIIEDLKEYISSTSGVILRIVRQDHSEFIDEIKYPDSYIVESESLKKIEMVASDGLDISLNKTPLAEYLTSKSGTIDEYEKNLVWEENKISIEKNSNLEGVFSTNKVRFVPKPMETSHLFRIHPGNHYRYYYYIKENKGAIIPDKDWGRFLALKDDKKNLILYNKLEKWVAIPSSTPLPVLLRKSLVLCSGLAPIQIFNQNREQSVFSNVPYLEVYFNVPYEIIKRISEKIGQKLNIYHHMGNKLSSLNLPLLSVNRDSQK